MVEKVVVEKVVVEKVAVAVAEKDVVAGIATAVHLPNEC